MSTLGIVAVSLLVGAFLILILAAAAAMVYLLYRARQTMDAFTKRVDDLQTIITSSLDSHSESLKLAIGRLNGEDLLLAAKLIPPAVKRMEHAAVAFGELAKALLSDQQLRSEDSPYGPEEYAPADAQSNFSLGRTAQLDLESEQQDPDS